MSTRTSRALLRATIATVTAAVAVALTPTGAQAGAVPDPVFAYLDVTAAPARQLSVANADGSQITTPTTVPFGLTPSGYQTYSYDVSEDGNTLLLGIRRGAPTAHVLDSTYALVLVHREGATTTSRVLTNRWSANAVLSADGKRAWWLDNDHVGRVTLWRHQETDWVAPGQDSALDNDNFLIWDATTDLMWFDVSPDGTKAAALSGAYTATGLTNTWVRATTIGQQYAGKITQAYKLSRTQAVSASFVWLSNSQLLWTVEGPSGLNSVVATVPDADYNTPPTLVPALKGFYDLHQYSGSWYMWKEIGPAGAEQSSLGSTADPLSPPADGALVPRSNGNGTMRYTPTTMAPPSLTAAANLMQSHPTLLTFASRGSAAYGTKVGYYASSIYGRIPDLGSSPTTVEAGGDEMFRGILQTSYDGITFRNAVSTTGSRLVRAGSAVYSGYTPVLARNTWFRWYYPGDFITTAAYSKVAVVKVVPRVAASVTRSGTSTTVRGTATRHSGTAWLQRNVGGRWTTVATTSLTYAGAYSFGARRLAHGSYRVLVLADRYWAAGVKALVL